MCLTWHSRWQEKAEFTLLLFRTPQIAQASTWHMHRRRCSSATHSISVSASTIDAKHGIAPMVGSDIKQVDGIIVLGKCWSAYNFSPSSYLWSKRQMTIAVRFQVEVWQRAEAYQRGWVGKIKFLHSTIKIDRWCSHNFFFVQNRWNVD
jgi:hypothetical protein